VTLSWYPARNYTGEACHVSDAKPNDYAVPACYVTDSTHTIDIHIGRDVICVCLEPRFSYVSRVPQVGRLDKRIKLHCTVGAAPTKDEHNVHHRGCVSRSPDSRYVRLRRKRCGGPLRDVLNSETLTHTGC